MASMTTPTRLGRGLVVPGIDTSQVDKNSTAWSFGGLSTPPQSAHESRRPSLQYSMLSEAPHSASSSTFSYSLPTTPVHNIGHGTGGMVNAWPSSVSVRAEVPTGAESRCGPGPIQELNLQTPFGQQTSYHPSSTHTSSPYTHVPSPNSAEVFGLQANSALSTADPWNSSHQMIHGLASQPTYLGPALFPASHTLGLDINRPVPSCDNGSSFQSSGTDFPASVVEGLQNYHVASSDIYHTPQVVAPSQLSPQDSYSQQGFNDFTTPDPTTDGLSYSFGSSSTSFTGFEIVDQPSPAGAYFDPSDDDEYMIVKEEEANDLDFATSSRKGSMKNGSHGSAKRRASKRLRNPDNKPWHSHIVGSEGQYTEVHCVGKRFRLDQPIKREIASSRKPHKCLFMKDDGQPCGARFDRSEHLKRHAGMHSKGPRPYPCPLPGCKQNIQRPDNAGDHFKRHLTPSKSGRRTGYFTWDIVSQTIWDKYEDKKKAKKLLDNLQRWVDGGMRTTERKSQSGPQ